MVWLGLLENVSAATLVVGVSTFCVLVSFLKRRQEKKLPPGPWGFPVFGVLPHMVRGASSVGVKGVFKNWYQRFGPIYRVKMGSCNMIILNDFKSIKDMLIHPEIQDRIKSDVTVGRPGEGILGSNGRVWHEQRKLVHQHFREFGVGNAKFEERIVSEAEFLTDALLKFEGKSLNLSDLFNNAASNVISSVCFGRRFDYNDESFQKVLRQFYANTEIDWLQSCLSTFLPFTKFLPFGSGKAIRDNFTSYHELHNTMVEEHTAKLSDGNIKDVMDAYLLEMKDKTGSDLADIFKDENMLWTIADLFGAGSETTSTTLRWVFLFLLNNPKIEAKLRAQLDSVVGHNRLPHYSDRQNLPYLEAVISESLRLGTVSSASLPHVAASNITLHGYNIQKGSIMVPNFHVLFTNGETWEEPETFKPERFLDEEGKFVKPEEFIPFSTGRRRCMGEQLAKMEMFIFVSHIVQKMKFSVPEGSTMPPIEGIEGHTYKPQPYKVSIKRCEE